MPLRLSFLCIALVLGGCHAKLKRFAKQSGALHLDHHVDMGPQVLIRLSDMDSRYINNAKNDVADDLQRRLNEHLAADAVHGAFATGVRDALGEGAPLTWSDDPAAGVLSVDVMSFGVTIPSHNIAGTYTYRVRVELYDPDGTSLFGTQVYCSTFVGQGPEPREGWIPVQTLPTLEAMSDAEIQAEFEGAAHHCGTELVRILRKRAG